MASPSEHVEILTAAIKAAKEDGLSLYVDHYPENRDILNLFNNKTGEQYDFPLGLVSVEVY